MSAVLESLKSNFSYNYLVNMRDLLLPASLLSFLSTTAYATSYHENVGVLQHVNPKIGTYGLFGDPNNNGGMIPSVSPPFGMTRWTAQTRYAKNYRSTFSCGSF